MFSNRQHKSPENNGRTNVHMMVLHLTVADLIVSFVVIPLEIGWRLSVQVNIHSNKTGALTNPMAEFLYKFMGPEIGL